MEAFAESQVRYRDIEGVSGGFSGHLGNNHRISWKCRGSSVVLGGLRVTGAMQSIREGFWRILELFREDYENSRRVSEALQNFFSGGFGRSQVRNREFSDAF